MSSVSNHEKLVADFYRSLIDEVAAGIQEIFVEEGYNSDVINELKKLWGDKIGESGAVPAWNITPGQSSSRGSNRGAAASRNAARSRNQNAAASSSNTAIPTQSSQLGTQSTQINQSQDILGGNHAPTLPIVAGTPSEFMPPQPRIPPPSFSNPNLGPPPGFSSGILSGAMPSLPSISPGLPSISPLSSAHHHNISTPTNPLYNTPSNSSGGGILSSSTGGGILASGGGLSLPSLPAATTPSSSTPNSIFSSTISLPPPVTPIQSPYGMPNIPPPSFSTPKSDFMASSPYLHLEDLKVTCLLSLLVQIQFWEEINLPSIQSPQFGQNSLPSIGSMLPPAYSPNPYGTPFSSSSIESPAYTSPLDTNKRLRLDPNSNDARLGNNNNPNFRQYDGANDDDDEDDEDDDSEEDEEEEEPSKSAASTGEEELGSDDDVEDDKDPDTPNIILAQYEKVTRHKNRWKCTLKCGIMHLDGKDYLFNKLTGDFEW
ncbi:predicted protein, partial [Naegleria gruberi]